MEGMATHPSIYVIHTYLTHRGYGNTCQYINLKNLYGIVSSAAGVQLYNSYKPLESDGLMETRSRSQNPFLMFL